MSFYNKCFTLASQPVENKRKFFIFFSILLVVLALDLFTKSWASTYVSGQNKCAYPECKAGVLPLSDCINTKELNSESQSSIIRSKEIIEGFFTLDLQNNTGAAWSFGSGNNGIFIFIILAFLVGVMIYLFRSKENMILSFLALSMIVGGASGNFYDRLVHDSVRDFLAFNIPLPTGNSYPYPVFNIADAFICVGAVIYFIDNFLFSSRRERLEKEKNANLEAKPLVKKNDLDQRDLGKIND